MLRQVGAGMVGEPLSKNDAKLAMRSDKATPRAALARLGHFLWSWERMKDQLQGVVCIVEGA